MGLATVTLRNLEYVVAVAEEAHFGRAAHRCNVSQPTLSAQIQRLERSLGTKIFERRGRLVRITNRGEQLIEQAKLILEQTRKLESLARRDSRPLCESFRLGVIATLGPYLLPYLLRPLKKAYPDLDLVLVEGLTRSLLEQLRFGRLDGLLASIPLPAGDFQTEKLFLEPFLLALTPGHRLARVEHLSPEMLVAEEMLLLQDGHCLRDQALEVCPDQHSKLHERYQATSLETMRQMVAIGLGYTLMPALAAVDNGMLKGLIRYRSFVKDPPGRLIGLAWRRGSSSAADAVALAAFIRKNLPGQVQKA